MRKAVYSIILLCIFVSIASAWTTPVNLTSDSYSDRYSDLEMDSSGVLHAIWSLTFCFCGLYYSNSSDGGVTWSTPSAKGFAVGIPVYPYYPDFEINNNILYVVVNDITGTGIQTDIYYINSSWSTAVNVSNNTGDSIYPRIKVDSNNNLFVIWEDNTTSQWDIYYSNSSNRGATWSTKVNISNTSGYSQKSDLEIDSNDNLYVIWADNTYGGQYDILYSNSSTRGTTWSTPVNISNNTAGYSLLSDLEIDSSGNLYVVWIDNVSGQNEVYYSNSSNRGATWSAKVNVSARAGNTTDADLEIDSNGILHIAYDDNTPGEYDIYYSTSSDKGATWGAATNISANANNSLHPDLELDSSRNPHVLWGNEEPNLMGVFFSKNVAVTSSIIIVTTEELTFMAVVIIFVLAFFYFILSNMKK